jgi:hypothetical protein
VPVVLCAVICGVVVVGVHAMTVQLGARIGWYWSGRGLNRNG